MKYEVFKIIPVTLDRWRIHNESGLIDEEISPHVVLVEHEFGTVTLKDAVGARPYDYFRAHRSAEGWQFKGRYKGRPLYW